MVYVNEYRTHLCGQVSEAEIGKEIRVAGWIENIRDHGGVKFLDLRDQSGVLQVVVYDESLLEPVNKECSVTISGPVVLRDPETVNPKIATGKIEVKAATLTVLGKAPNALPFEVENSTDTKEDVRLKYRFLDLRNPKVHNKILLRSQVISFLRNKMQELGFMEIQTPILHRPPRARATTSSQAAATRGNSMRSRRLRRFSNSCSWCLDLTATSKLPPASAMRTPVQTVRPGSSTSLTLKWPLPPKRMS